MNPKVKQRIIGSLVLLFVIAIFLPIVFHNTRPMLNSHTLNQNLNDLDSNDNPGVKISPSEPSNSQPQISSVAPVSVTKTNEAPKPQEIENLERKITHQPATSPDEQTRVEKPIAKPILKNNNKSVKVTVVKQSSVLIDKKTLVSSVKTNEPVIVKDILLTEQPKAWIVQLGVFSNRQRALKLLHELRSKKYQAYMAHFEEDKTGSVRVNVGPLINRDKIKFIQQNIKKEFKINGMIKEYQP